MMTKEEFDTIEKLLDNLEAFIFQNEYLFLRHFGKGKWVEIVEITFSCDIVKFVYLINTGQSVVDTISIKSFKEWMKNTKEINEKYNQQTLYKET